MRHHLRRLLVVCVIGVAIVLPAAERPAFATVGFDWILITDIEGYQFFKDGTILKYRPPYVPSVPYPPPAGYGWVWTAAGWTLVAVAAGVAIYESWQYASTVDQIWNDPSLGNVGLTPDDLDCMGLNVFSGGYWNCFAKYYGLRR